MRHSYVGTEHLLLGLLRVDDGRAAATLASLGVTHARVRRAVVGMMGVGVEPPEGDLPLTDPAQAAVERAGREASAMGAERVGTEHILLALVRDPSGAATRILKTRRRPGGDRGRAQLASPRSASRKPSSADRR